MTLTDCPSTSSLQICTVVLQLPRELHDHNVSAAVTEVLRHHSGLVAFDGHVARIGARRIPTVCAGQEKNFLFDSSLPVSSPQRLVAIPPPTARWTRRRRGAESIWRPAPFAPQLSSTTSPAGLYRLWSKASPKRLSCSGWRFDPDSSYFSFTVRMERISRRHCSSFAPRTNSPLQAQILQ